MYSRALGEKVRKRISPIKELAGRGVGSSWLAQPYHKRMSSACMGKPSCSHSSRGEDWGVVRGELLSPVSRFSMARLRKPHTCLKNWQKIISVLWYPKSNPLFKIWFCGVCLICGIITVCEERRKRACLTPHATKSVLAWSWRSCGWHEERHRFNRIGKGINRKHVCNAPWRTTTNQETSGNRRVSFAIRH